MTKTYFFTLVLRGVNETTPNLEDELYEVHCDDALVNFRNGTVYLDFDRAATTLENAIISAIRDVESSSLGVSVVHVSPDDWVSESEIAKRLQKPRQTVSLWVKGERRTELPFPSPMMKLSEKSPLWRWSEVTKWLYQSDIIVNEEMVEMVQAATLIENMNSALEERNEENRQLRHALLEKLGQLNSHSQLSL